MQLEYKKVHLYVGGGITASSNPEAEFYETVNKSKTIKKILGT
jgi:isochorismate synthase